MHVLIGVSAGIAAYKIPLLIRLLIKQGHSVKVILTPDAVDFVSPLVLSTLSKQPVAIEFWNRKTGEWHNHVAYAEWADVLLVAPCTANTLAKMVYAITFCWPRFYPCANGPLWRLLWILKCTSIPR